MREEKGHVHMVRGRMRVEKGHVYMVVEGG